MERIKPVRRIRLSLSRGVKRGVLWRARVPASEGEDRVDEEEMEKK